MELFARWHSEEMGGGASQMHPLIRGDSPNLSPFGSLRVCAPAKVKENTSTVTARERARELERTRAKENDHRHL